MIIVGIELIHTFAKDHADARTFLRLWVSEVEATTWRHPSDIKARYATASFLAGDRIVFNIKGNRYRLLTQVNYDYGTVTILQIGTHGEYNRWKL